MIKKIILSLFLVCFWAFAVFAVDRDMPKTRRIKISSGITEVVLDIYPTLGVKCIFPWVLSENSKELPYTGKLINSSLFAMNRLDGQNYVLFNIAVQGGNIENAMSDAFINVAGYHIVFRLRATLDDRKHYSSVVFDLGEAEKLDLIERSIQRRMIALRKDFELKEKELDKRANMLALKLVGRMSLSKPKKHRIKTENVLKLSNGDKIIFYCETIYDYGTIFVIPIEIENKSGMLPLYIQNVGLEKYDKADTSFPIISEFEVEDIKLSNNKFTSGFVVTEDSRLIKNGDTKCTVFTDRGNVVVEW